MRPIHSTEGLVVGQSDFHRRLSFQFRGGRSLFGWFTPECIIYLTSALVTKRFCTHQLSLRIEALCENVRYGQGSRWDRECP